MKIISKKEFYDLKEPVLFQPYEPEILGNLLIKDKTLYDNKTPIDYIELDLNVCVNLNECNDNIKLTADYDSYSRNGEFKEEQQYLIYEKEDVEKLIKKLKELL